MGEFGMHVPNRKADLEIRRSCPALAFPDIGSLFRMNLVQQTCERFRE